VLPHLHISQNDLQVLPLPLLLLLLLLRLPHLHISQGDLEVLHASWHLQVVRVVVHRHNPAGTTHGIVVKGQGSTVWKVLAQCVM
jgi:hypothetical protein